jgi:hypothetical protein
MESKLDLVQLRRLAEAATPGPWVKRKGDRDVVKGPLAVNRRGFTEGFPNGVGGQSICECDDMDYSEHQANRNARFIAAFNPTAVLELLDQLEEYKHVAIAKIEAACEKAQPGSILPK